MALLRNRDHLVERGVLSVLVLCLLVSSNTIIGSEFYDGFGAKACLLASNLLCAGIVARGLLRKLITLRELGIWMLFVGVFGVSYVAIWLHSADPGSAVQLAALTILYLMGMVWVVLNREGHVRLLLDAIVNVIYVLAALSLVLWVLGPLWEFIPANIKMTYSWAPGDGTGTKINGYYYFLFFTQSDVILGRAIARNSGVFVESPLYGFVLLVGLLTEVFLVRRRIRKCVVVVLLATILSTFSITAYLILAMVCAYPLYFAIRDLLGRIRGNPLKIALFVLVSLVLLGVFAVVVAKKVTSPSWAIRMDDYVAGFRAWMKSPILGNGLKSDQTILNQMAGFRINNTGMSNSIMQVLAFGGIALLASYAVGIVGFFLRRKPKLMYFGAVYAVMWAVTVVTYLPISMAVLGMGLGETMLYLNRSSLAGGPAKRMLGDLGVSQVVAAACATAGIALLAWSGMYLLASLALPPSFVARTGVEVRNLKDNKLITDAYSLDHVAYLLGSQNVHLTTTSQLGIEDSDAYLTEADVVPNGVEMRCTSPDETGSTEFARQAVKAGSKVSWMVKNKLTLRYGEITCDRYDQGTKGLAAFFALSVAALVAGASMLVLGRTAGRAGEG